MTSTHTEKLNGFTPQKGYDYKAILITDTGTAISKKGFYGRTVKEAEDKLSAWMDEQGITEAK